ncbi:MAG TPA: glycosyltransferase [Candidatus Baltobacteraceae bacterium]|nr:glycosyltransferase [Candidatus Baltobacteraceae bacterium]
MRVALVHDYLNQRGGAERVFAHIARAYPDAPVYTALYDARQTGDLVPPSRVRTSFLAKIPQANRYFRYLAPLYPAAFERFDFSGYDTIISSTTAWAKGIVLPSGAVHVCYINTVSRFLFDYDAYVGGLGARAFVRPIVRRLADWDRRAARLPTQFIANSRNVAERIKRYYGRESLVLHAPVDVNRFTVGMGGGDYFFIASRLLPYKRIDLAIEAANAAGVRLLVAGTGPMYESLCRLARGTTTTMLGFVSDERLNELLGAARAALLPGQEDYGLVPLEAAACGRPAIAFRGGGALETIVEGATGEYFDEQTPQSLASVLRSFDERRYDAEHLREHAQQFGPDRFIERLRAIVERIRSAP